MTNDPRLRPQLGFPPATVVRGPGTVTVPRSQGPVQIGSSQPGAMGPQTGTYVRLPGSNFPPAGSTPVDPMADATIAAGATAIILTYVVPSTVRCRIAGIGFSADDETALAFLTWSLQSDGASIQDYYSKPAAVGSVRGLTEIVVNLAGGSTLTVSGAVMATAGYTQPGSVPVSYRYVCRLRGWLYSESQEGT